MKYIRPFDGVRGIAVLLVIIWHWFEKEKINLFPNGPFGVRLFFVLSGFLITGILLESKNLCHNSIKDKKNNIKRFFIRRALRIFPIYYLIVVAFFIHAAITYAPLDKYLYYLTYTSNIYFYKTGSWDVYLAHIWSLAVEEQFYLVWPLPMIFIADRYLLLIISLFIATGLASQWIVGEEGFGEVLTFTCFDALGMGALLAWVKKFKPFLLKNLAVASGIVAILVSALLYIEIFQLSHFVIPLRMQLTFVAFFVITYIVYSSHNDLALPKTIDFVLNNKLLVLFGKISYGLYLYHLLIPYGTTKIMDRIYNWLPPFLKEHYQALFILINLVLLLVVSALSWKWIEKPLLGLKKNFGSQWEQKFVVMKTEETRQRL